MRILLNVRYLIGERHQRSHGAQETVQQHRQRAADADLAVVPAELVAHRVQTLAEQQQMGGRIGGGASAEDDLVAA